jgi:hypothetical protein
MEPDTLGREAAPPVPTPIRGGQTPRGRCYASSSNTGAANIKRFKSGLSEIQKGRHLAFVRKPQPRTGAANFRGTRYAGCNARNSLTRLIRASTCGRRADPGAWAFAGLAVGHAAAALFHHFVLRDEVLESMAPVIAMARPKQELATGHIVPETLSGINATHLRSCSRDAATATSRRNATMRRIRPPSPSHHF